MIKDCLKWMLIVLPLTVFSQNPDRLDSVTNPVSIRINVPGLVDVFDGNISAGVEYGIGPRWSVTADLAMVIYSAYFNDAERALGYIFKPGIRYYFSTDRRGFFEGGFFYKRVGYKLSDWLQQDVVNGVPSYEEFKTFIYVKRVLEFHVICGYKARLNRSGNLWLEFYGGLGIRKKWQDIKNNPDASYDRNNLFDINSVRDPRGVAPGFPGGLRLIVDLN